MAPSYRIALSLCLAGMSIRDRKRLGESLGVSITSSISKSEAIRVLEAVLGDSFPRKYVKNLTGRGYSGASVFVAACIREAAGLVVDPDLCARLFRRASHQGMELTEEGRSLLGDISWPPNKRF
jgi:hypothetical protein